MIAFEVRIGIRLLFAIWHPNIRR